MQPGECLADEGSRAPRAERGCERELASAGAEANPALCGLRGEPGRAERGLALLRLEVFVGLGDAPPTLLRPSLGGARPTYSVCTLSAW